MKIIIAHIVVGPAGKMLDVAAVLKNLAVCKHKGRGKNLVALGVGNGFILLFGNIIIKGKAHRNIVYVLEYIVAVFLLIKFKPLAKHGIRVYLVFLRIHIFYRKKRTQGIIAVFRLA